MDIKLSKTVIALKKLRFVVAVFLSVAVVYPAYTVDLYGTGFEASEDPAFIVGPLPQNGWVQVTGPSVSSVTDTIAFESTQSLQIAPDSVISTTLSNNTHPIVYIDSWFRPTLSPALLDLSGLEDSSAIFVFHETEGIVLLDGNGAGGGSWLETGFTALSDFIRITVCLDFTQHTWDFYVNATLLGQGLGFKNNSIDSLSGLHVTSSASNSSFLDGFRVTTTEPEFIVTATPTSTQTPTSTSSPTPTMTFSQTPTFSETATVTPTVEIDPIGSPEFWYVFSSLWREGPGPDHSKYDGVEDNKIDTYDLLYFLGQSD